MNSIDLATREIFWNIPHSYKLTMYALFFISMGIFVYGFYKKFQFVLGGKSLREFKGELLDKLNWKSFFQTIFFTGKVPRSKDVFKFHSLIYFGFIILWIATDLVAIHADTPFKIYKGWVYIIISFLADIAGVAILIGLSMAYYRRYIKKPDYLSATKPSRENSCIGCFFF